MDQKQSPKPQGAMRDMQAPEHKMKSLGPTHPEHFGAQPASPSSPAPNPSKGKMSKGQC